jgi:pantoate--beta-alanine ligase
VQPAYAIFGKKDYQQWMVLTRMAQQFALPTHVIGLATVRAGDGLALSSRNGYLSENERGEAVALSRALHAAALALRAGATEVAAVEQAQLDALSHRGWKPDYLTIRRRGDLLPPTPVDLAAKLPLVALAAARLGPTRLIDNLEIDF